MNHRDDEPLQEPQIGEGTGKPDEVRAVMEQSREALEASGAELERAKRLLRETEKSADRAVPPNAESATSRQSD